jgi:hypothetical protein
LDNRLTGSVKQGAHALAAAGAAVFAAHAAHVVDAAAPVAAEYVPGAQLVQLTAPGDAWKKPETQLVQAAAPILENDPAGQAEQDSTPTTALKEPAAQAVHAPGVQMPVDEQEHAKKLGPASVTLVHAWNRPASQLDMVKLPRP